MRPGDISIAFPHRLVRDNLERFEKLDQVIPSINPLSTLHYALEVKFGSSGIKSDKDLHTNVYNPFGVGEVTGAFGSNTGADATEIIAARRILADLEFGLRV